MTRASRRVQTHGTRAYFPGFASCAGTEGGPDRHASIVDPAWNEMMPTTYVIDASGKTVKRLQGVKSFEEFLRVVQQVARCGPGTGIP